MDVRHVSGNYFVSPQLAAEDLATLKSDGFATVICNRPDGEVPPGQQSAEISAAAEIAGLTFENHPLTHQTMTPENVAHQMSVTEAATGKVLAYCASGTRSTVAWALAQAGQMPVSEILATAAHAGYDLSGLKPALQDRADGA